MPSSGIAALLADLVGRLPEAVPTSGLYAAGSLGTSDFQPDRSDVDLVAIVATPLGGDQRKAVEKVHRQLSREHAAGGWVHCVYVAVEGVADRRAEWPYWADAGWRERRFDAIARAELHDHGVVVAGPPVSTLVPFVTHEELIEDVRAELAGFWLPATEQKARWWADEWVDLGLTVLPRARAALADGSLISKSQAISQLGDFGVPGWLRENLQARRRGWVAELDVRTRRRRAALARQLVRAGAESLLAQPPV